WGGESTLTPAGASVQEPRLAQPSLGSPILCALHPVSISTNQDLPDTCSGVAMGTRRRGECGAHSCPWTHTESMHACVRAHLHVFTRPGHHQVFTQRCTRTPLQVCTRPTRLRPQVCVCSRTRSGSPPTPHTVHSVPGGHTCLGAPGSLSPCHLCVHVCAHACPGTPVCVHDCPDTRGSPSPCHPKLLESGTF
ncbi:hypothetical protein H8957_017654, partial [Semnopithecus entellus]